jgi:hypothetical protein
MASFPRQKANFLAEEVYARRRTYANVFIGLQGVEDATI